MTGQYPIIERGLGVLSPALWRRMMNMLRNYEEGTRDETRKNTSSGGSVPFLAELTKAKCIDPNRYIYAWRQIVLNDNNSWSVVTDGKTSTGDSDEYDFAAVNLLEIANSSTRTSAGVSMEGDYPAGWTMQAMGGGSCSGTGCEVSIGSVIVMVFKVGGRNTETIPRYVFSAVNEHDGTCTQHGISLEDGIEEPTIPEGATYGYLYVLDTDGKVHFIDKDGNDHDLE